MSEFPERVIKSMGCHDCIFEQGGQFKYKCVLDDTLCCTGAAANKEHHIVCPLKTHNIRVVGNEVKDENV